MGKDWLFWKKKMDALDTNKKESYKLLGYKQVDKLDAKRAIERVKK